ncbi:nucleotidyltransferase [Sphingobacterium olei]|uniref:Nucleotidyltransferase n=1 Tax=Sphingobacterium olei TaxID=2571155 RepID=A0A4U0NNZ9_9SPHI|nr:nucleotidyltransferase domain-containing protein [Sphingobacterium olei]TJZ51824.1 nucleotidyltransferase [Sphingobacterium olei]
MTIKELRDQGLILFEAIVGSRAYGLATTGSDTDIKGVFYLPRDQYFGSQYIAQVNSSSNDEVYYELGRFVELLSKSNPNILELLASPAECILYKNPIFESFRVEDFITRETVSTFARYAMVQIRKAQGLSKKVNNPMDPKRKSLIDFCFILEGNDSIPLKEWLRLRKWKQEGCGLTKINHTRDLYALFYDPIGNLEYKGIIAKSGSQEVSCTSVPKSEVLQAYLFVNQDAYSSYCKAYKEYFDWVVRRNENRFQGTLKHGQGYDAKNMMHTIRLLELAKEILLDGILSVRRPNREYLLKIKSGYYSYDDLCRQSERLMKEIDVLSKSCTLPERPDSRKLAQLLVSIREQLYK